MGFWILYTVAVIVSIVCLSLEFKISRYTEQSIFILFLFIPSIIPWVNFLTGSLVFVGTLIDISENVQDKAYDDAPIITYKEFLNYFNVNPDKWSYTNTNIYYKYCKKGYDTFFEEHYIDHKDHVILFKTQYDFMRAKNIIRKYRKDKKDKANAKERKDKTVAFLQNVQEDINKLKEQSENELDEANKLIKQCQNERTAAETETDEFYDIVAEELKDCFSVLTYHLTFDKDDKVYYYTGKNEKFFNRQINKNDLREIAHRIMKLRGAE